MPRDPVTRVIRRLTGSEAMERHLKLVQFDTLGLSLNKINNRHVFHYTNVAGLRGILDSECLWASDHRFLNDASEIRFGLQILEMFIASTNGVGDHITREFRDEILMAIALLTEGHLGAYVLSVSFCRRGNLLSQWRAYGARDGLAICFDRSFLEKKASSQKFVTGNIRYYFNPEKGTSDPPLDQWLICQLDMLSAKLSKVKSGVMTELPHENVDIISNLVDGCRRRAIDRWLLETAAFIKHPIFAEEAEWRCVAITEPHAQADIKIKDRASGSRVIPYADFSLGALDDKHLGISRIVIGPNAKQNALEDAVSHLFSVRGIGLGSIITPYNPLRT